MTTIPAPAPVALARLPAIVRLLCLAAVGLIPMRILAQGFLPGDDALRHAAKAVSEKSWPEILVLRSDITVESHPGWEALLGAAHRGMGFDAHAIVLLTVIGLSIAVSLPALLRLRRPEAWLLSLLVFAVMDFPALTRLFLGRPFLWNDATLVAVCFALPWLGAPRVATIRLLGLTVLFALAAWVHPAWYLFLLPVLACALARQWRAAVRLLVCLAVGVLGAGLLSGRPVAYLGEALLRGYLATAGAPGSLVFELRPRSGRPLAEMALLAVLAWRALRGRFEATTVGSPLFLVVVLGWALGFHSMRFWTDWAVPAAMVWLALELEDVLVPWMGDVSPRRVALAGVAGLVCVLAITTDGRGMWKRADFGYALFLRAENATHLPEPGGVLYCREMAAFFELFYRRPNAPWRYMVGFEPGILPAEDLATYRAILESGRPEAYRPWVQKMRPADRMIARASGPEPPEIGGLEWRFVGLDLWSGRLPR